MLYKRLLYVITLSVFIASCSSDSDDPVDVTIPEIDMLEEVILALTEHTTKT